jgi:DMATS type aromatic prenyltransferase
VPALNSSHVRESIADSTLLSFGSERLRGLCQSIGNQEHADGNREYADAGEFLALFKRMVQPWGERTIGHTPRYPSNISDDEAPYEFCVAFSDGPPEVQVYVEPQGTPPSLRSNMAASKQLLGTLAREQSASLERLHGIDRLFFPEQPVGAFTLWIGASWQTGRRPRLKVYLNPQVRGAAAAPQLMANAMQSLGFGRAWRALSQAFARGPVRRDEVSIVCLDLLGFEQPRVKVYVRHHAATVSDINEIARIALDHQPRDLHAFYLAVAESEGPFLNKPALTEFAFVDPEAARPTSVTLEFPIGTYVASDEIACARIRRCMTSFGISPDTYERVVRAFATRPLASSSGVHAHVTFRRLSGKPRIAVYLTSEAYRSRLKPQNLV